MISCEKFESLYPLVNSPEVQQHRLHCPSCLQYTQEYAALRRTLNSLAFEPAPLGLEIRLKHRLAEIEYGKTRQWKALPRAAAFAAGMALVMIAGGIYLRPQNNPLQPIAQNPPAEEQSIAAVDSTLTPSDSVTVPPPSPWGDFSRMETVSAQP